MENNFYNDLLFVLQNNNLRTMPSQDLISNHKDIALAVWKNFSAGEDYYGYSSLHEWYSEGKWKEVLSNYKNDNDFWKEAINNSQFSPYEILSHLSFKNDFPEAFSHLMNDKEFVKHMVTHSDNRFVFDLLGSSSLSKDEIDDLYKNEILKNLHNFNDYKVKEYEHDGNFVTTLLIKYPSFYNKLDTNHKNNDDYIQLALKDSRNFEYLSDKNKEKYFQVWLEANKDKKLWVRDIEKFGLTQQSMILKTRPESIPQMLDTQFSQYKSVAIEAIQAHLEKNIDYFTEAQVVKLFKSSEDLAKIKPMLEDFANTYQNPKQFSKKENKIMALISLDKNLKETLENNIFYQLNIMSPQQKITKEVFEGYFQGVDNKVKNEGLAVDKANAFLARMKNKLPTSVLVEQKYPDKDLYSHLESQMSRPKMKM